MVHELLGLNNNRVKLKGAPGVKGDKDLEEVVLSSADDKFYAAQKFANFGDLGSSVKTLLDDYQRQTKMNENISSIEDMQAFMERSRPRRPETRQEKLAATPRPRRGSSADGSRRRRGDDVDGPRTASGAGTPRSGPSRSTCRSTWR